LVEDCFSGDYKVNLPVSVLKAFPSGKRKVNTGSSYAVLKPWCSLVGVDRA
jgi:hypothetical protein